MSSKKETLEDHEIEKVEVPEESGAEINRGDIFLMSGFWRVNRKSHPLENSNGCVIGL